MYCKKCGKHVPSDAKFCPYCGKSQNGQNNFSMLGNVKNLIDKNKPLSYVYLGWVLVNFTLWLFSSNTSYDRQGNSYDISDGFYPFYTPFTVVVENSYYDDFSLIENIDVYDFSEFFLYSFLLPLLFVGLKKSFSYISEALKRRTNSIAPSLNNKADKEILLVDSSSASAGDESARMVEEKTDNQNKAGISLKCNLENTSKVKSDPKEEKAFPLWRRAIGSAIDKIIIVVLFLVGYEVLHPYSAFGNIGLFMGLMDTNPTSYEYVDKTHIANYGSYYQGIDKDYLDKVYKEEGKPYIGQTKDIIMSMTYSFVLWNMFYYILFELLLCASPGKYIMGGRLFGFEEKLRRIGKVLLRGIIFGALLFTLVFLFQYEKIANYYTLILVFFIILDIPLLFTAFSMKCSLLDLLSNTNYVDVLRKEDFVGKYKYETKKV